MRFLVDAQLPTALARWIDSQGQTAQHVADLQMAGASDRAIWQQARETGAVIVSKDADFVTLARWMKKDRQWCGSAWAIHDARPC